MTEDEILDTLIQDKEHILKVLKLIKNKSTEYLKQKETKQLINLLEKELKSYEFIPNMRKGE